MDREALLRILGYLDHIEEPSYLSDSLQLVGVTRLVETIDRRAGHRFCRDRLLLFLQDALIHTRGEEVPSFRATFFASAGFARFQQDLLTTQDWLYRDQLVSLVSKTGWPNAADLLLAMVPDAASTDPLLLPHLFFEIGWSLGQNRWPLRAALDHVLEHSCWISRWALATWYSDTTPRAGHSLPQHDIQRLQRLAQDPHPIVSALAAFCLERLEFIARADRLPKNQRRAMGRAFSKREPTPRLGDLSVRFRNTLYGDRRKSYEMAELESFILGEWRPAA